MKRHIFSTALLLLFIASVTAQKEVYFNVLKEKDIKVESLIGLDVQLNTEPLSLIQSINNPGIQKNIPLSFCYFSEIRIAASSTLIFKAGVINNFTVYTDYKTINDSIKGNPSTYYNISKPVYFYNLALNFSFEPRWYWNFKDRFQAGLSRLNSGWFLSLPVQFVIPTPLSAHTKMLNEYSVNGQWINNYFIINGYIIPTVGFRQALSANWLLEGIVDLSLSTSYSSYTYYSHNISAFSSLVFSPELKIKAAYTFK